MKITEGYIEVAGRTITVWRVLLATSFILTMVLLSPLLAIALVLNCSGILLEGPYSYVEWVLVRLLHKMGAAHTSGLLQEEAP